MDGFCVFSFIRPACLLKLRSFILKIIIEVYVLIADTTLLLFGAACILSGAFVF